jgi:hypothetical protein
MILCFAAGAASSPEKIEITDVKIAVDAAVPR